MPVVTLAVPVVTLAAPVVTLTVLVVTLAAPVVALTVLVVTLDVPVVTLDVPVVTLARMDEVIGIAIDTVVYAAGISFFSPFIVDDDVDVVSTWPCSLNTKFSDLSFFYGILLLLCVCVCSLLHS